jgi:hypothetical protein
MPYRLHSDGEYPPEVVLSATGLELHKLGETISRLDSDLSIEIEQRPDRDYPVTLKSACFELAQSMQKLVMRVEGDTLRVSGSHPYMSNFGNSLMDVFPATANTHLHIEPSMGDQNVCETSMVQLVVVQYA